MTAIELTNQVFDKYYHNEYIPSKIGGSPETAIVQFLVAITNAIAIEQKKASISENWIGDTVTWFTRELPQLLLLPKFPDETDERYLDRIFDFAAAQELGGQSTRTIQAVIFSLLDGAINVPDDVVIVTATTGSNLWKDEGEGPTFDAYWSQGYLWADTSETLISTIKIKIYFTRTGSDTDPLTYDYWALSQNYTKIQDVVMLFKTPGITFELELISP